MKACGKKAEGPGQTFKARGAGNCSQTAKQPHNRTTLAQAIIVEIQNGKK